MLKKFNIRIYGLLIENGNVLVADELVKGTPVTKFPGGGLELGEGPLECLVREFKEETGLDISVKAHFYTTDFFQQSAFNPEHQIISIYYLVENSSKRQSAGITHSPPGLQQPNEQILSFRWIVLKDLEPAHLSLPIDKVVAEKLMEEFTF